MACGAPSARRATLLWEAPAGPPTGAYGSSPAAGWRCSIRAVHRLSTLPPVVHLAVSTGSGRDLDHASPAHLEPDDDRVQFRYTGIHLSAPERVQYSYKLDGLDRVWVRAGSRRLINYNSLKHGRYRFTVRAEVPGGPASEQSYGFEVLPYFYETAWFRVLCAAVLLAMAGGRISASA